MHVIGIDPLGVWCEPFCDGEAIYEYVEACEEGGWVDVLMYDEQGQRIKDAIGTGWLTQRLSGHVRIMLPEEAPLALSQPYIEARQAGHEACVMPRRQNPWGYRANTHNRGGR
mgnify:CR=1 FL=1